MNPASPSTIVLDAAATWPGITTQPTPRGSTAIVFEGHELGHVHSDRKTLDLPLPDERRAEVLEAARAKPWFSNWVSKPLTTEEDAQDGLALLREGYDALNDQRVSRLLGLMREGDDAFNRHDVPAMNAAHHPDVIAHITGRSEPTYGLAAHAADLEGMLRAFPDIHVENDPYPVQFGQGEWMTVVSRVAGTCTGELVLPDGNVIPGTGKAFEVNFSTTARWHDDQLVEEYVFWDSALMAQQIGLA